MKPYFAISFLIAFMQIYALGAEEVTPTAGDSEGDQKPTETTVITTCTVSASEQCNSKPCDKFSGTKEVSVGTHVLCTENCWLRCDKNGSGTQIVVATVRGTDGFTPCDAGSIFHGDKCLSCTDLTGEENATSEAGKATTMSDCTIAYVQGATYQDEKGTFEYLSECAIGCTEETEYYCTSV